MVKKKSNEILILTVLLVVTVSLNFVFVVIIQSSDQNSIPTKVLKSLTGEAQYGIVIGGRDVGFTYEVSDNKKTTTRIKPKPAEPKPMENPTNNPQITDSQNQKIIYYKSATGDVPILVDYSKGTYTISGKEYPIIIDGDPKEIKIENPANKDASAWVNPQYSVRFDAFIEQDFYNSNRVAIDDLMNKFADRYDLLEQITGWSSEQFIGQKLEIYVDGNGGSSCWSGWAFLGESHVSFSGVGFSNPSFCNVKYFDGDSFVLGNPGELGDRWNFMSGLLHESLHAINPAPVLSRSWLTEGFSQYYGLNILSNYNGNGFTDINQETADHYIQNANFTTNQGSFAEYVSNDYKDKFNLEIQSSQGYDITAWMFSKMRDEHGLDWQNFFDIINNNQETLDYSRSVGLATSTGDYTDTYVIDVFGMASGLSFNDTKEIWQYDGPSGPGWGVRNWEDTSWYSDLTPVLSFSGNNIKIGNQINVTASVYNQGDTSLIGVSVRFYNDTTLLDEQFVDITANSNVIVNMPFVGTTEGDYNIQVRVDEDNVKVESDETNNNDLGVVSFYTPNNPSCTYDKYTQTYRCS